MLFPQAALHQTISSVSGSNSVKQIGQSPVTSLRLLEESVDGWELTIGAFAKISRSSWKILLKCSRKPGYVAKDLLKKGERVDTVGSRGL